MKYRAIETGIFLQRPNRFIAHAEVEGKEVICHVKNTGRCRELLVPGATVYLEKSENPNRKTAYDLIGVKKGERLVNMDSQIPNYVVGEWLKKGNLFSSDAKIRPETVYGSSRFDLYVEDGQRRAFIEVKGVTLEEDGTAAFPDAPTLRGVKHVKELIHCVKEGYEAYLIFVIQMEQIRRFVPNWKTHPEFGQALQEAKRAGVHILAYTCRVVPDEIVMDTPVTVCLEKSE